MDKYAAEGSTVTENYIPVNQGIELRTISFVRSDPEITLQIIFFPGWISQISGWRYFLPKLTSVANVTYVETREKTSSRIAMSNDFSVKSLANDIVSFVSQSGITDQKYVLLGSSLGATAILEAYPLLHIPPTGLALILPNSQFGLPRYSTLLRYIPTPLLPFIKTMAKWAVLKFKVNPYDIGHHERFITAINAVDPVKLKQSALGIIDYQMQLDQLKSYLIPSLVIGASQDKEHDQTEIVNIASSLPSSEYHDLKTFTASHSRQAADVVISWLRQLSNIPHV